MKKFSLPIPSVHLGGLNIPVAWKVFMWIAIIVLLIALGHDGYVFNKYGLGWQKELEIPEAVVQEFQEQELDSVLALLKERERELARLAVEGIIIKNRFLLAK